MAGTMHDPGQGGSPARSAPAPLVLTIFDGMGYSADQEGNAVQAACMPCLDRLVGEYPKTLLKASGRAVGLPEGQMGNSEVGHLNMGAGRIVYQELTRITKAIEDKVFFRNAVLLKAMRETGDGALHLLGLISDGGVHSHIEHVFALLEMAVAEGVEDVFVHVLLDGRDVLPQSAKTFIIRLEQKMAELGRGKIATVCGRYYAMDRDKRWDRVEKAYLALAEGEGLVAPSALAAVEKSYDLKVSDEFVEPTVVVDSDGKPVAAIDDGDTVIFFNFRADRARELTRAFTDENFVGFEIERQPQINFVCLTQYDAMLSCPVAFPPQNLENTLGRVLADNGVKQLRIAETEKYAHVTFFFNGGVEEPDDFEERCLIPSPAVATYNLKPEMSACEVTDEVLKRLAEGDYGVVILNFANPDMVGHTGFFQAAVEAMEVVDGCLERIAQAVEVRGGTLIVTADHGNAERMYDEEAEAAYTAHTSNKVPFVLADSFYKGRELRSGGSLADIAPTVLDILGIEIPAEMTGKSLLASKQLAVGQQYQVSHNNELILDT
ncbi:MAG: 2,3-bisphosphoglycerate-independent phosphoglycerate mutase [Peptococcaceae bacterium]|jgi:2,3-bisphosphoglycerate-independent phosphoglycerate mutase|nr:2,3-bisphosphoglycerate-independent phosphoglycerate mutase [Peptococcaceae bacterium]MDR2736214.1 2,3-bisphosphoglycerate-independent phosphoglycerate mutase [Gracilibacteraceae bacterium]